MMISWTVVVAVVVVAVFFLRLFLTVVVVVVVVVVVTDWGFVLAKTNKKFVLVQVLAQENQNKRQVCFGSSFD